MSLKVQILSFIFSFVYGLLFSGLVKINYNVLFLAKKKIQIIGNFLFLLDIALCYFLIIRYINDGILHIYFLILFLFGWYIGNFLLDRIIKK